MLKILVDIFGCRQPGRIVFFLPLPKDREGPVSKTPEFLRHIKGEADVATEITVVQKLTPKIKGFKDAKGNPAKVDSKEKIVWSTDNTDLVALKPGDDGLSCEITPLGPLGVATVQATADADLGDGVKPIHGVITIHIIPSQAVEIDIDPGEPEDQNPAPEPMMATEDLESLTVSELRALAEEKKVDLSGLHLKDEIIKAIKKAKA